MFLSKLDTCYPDVQEKYQPFFIAMTLNNSMKVFHKDLFIYFIVNCQYCRLSLFSCWYSFTIRIMIRSVSVLLYHNRYHFKDKGVQPEWFHLYVVRLDLLGLCTVLSSWYTLAAKLQVLVFVDNICCQDMLWFDVSLCH